MKIVEPNFSKNKSNSLESGKHLPRMKSTTYITEITTQKYEKNLSEGRKPGSICLLVCSLRVNKEIFRVSLLKSVLPFLINQAAQFILHGIYWSLLYFQEYSSTVLKIKILVLSVKMSGRIVFWSDMSCSYFPKFGRT